MKTNEIIRGYITKYALSSGIYEAELELCGDNMVRQINPRIYSCYFHGEGKEWHRTIESAEKRFEQIKIVKLKSLEKQIDKVSKMKFRIKPLEQEVTK